MAFTLTSPDAANCRTRQVHDQVGTDFEFWADAVRASIESHRRDLATPRAASLDVRLQALEKAARLAPVVFDHWVHRARYTCRLCHVDVGFAMKAGATGIRAADNIAGQYCGACHDGRRQSAEGRKVFAACTKTVPSDTSIIPPELAVNCRRSSRESETRK